MNRKVKFPIFLLLSALAVNCFIAAYCQDNYRLSRPTDKYVPNIEPAPPIQRSINTPNNFNDDSQSVRINIPPSHLKNPALLDGSVSSNSLTQVQIQKLAAHDIVLLIDKSGSMATADCPINGSSGGLKTILPGLLFGGNPFANTRWQWCQQQIAQMSSLTHDALPAGFSVLLFDSGYYLFPHVTSETLPRIFQTNSPGGGTILTSPLSAVFNDYFKRQKLSGGRIKPLLIGIITDGCPNEPRSVRQLIANTTHLIQDPRQITIIFFLIGGHDPQGEKFVRDLTEKAQSDGASFNMVKSIPFSDVQNAGLVRTLADNLD